MNGALLCLLFVAFAESVKLPPNFKKCNRKQPDLKRCVLEAARHAVPQMVQPLEEVGLPGLDPLEIPEATIRSGSGRVAVDQNFKNCRFHHLHEVKVNEFEFDFDTKTIAAALLFPQIDIKCEYKLNGTVLLLPIRGEGHSTIVLQNLKAQGFVSFTELKRRGQTYLKFVSSKFDIDPSFISYNFENLFDGDRELGANINKVLNDNWREVFEDVKSDYIEIISQILLGMIGNFFDKVSLEEAFDD